MTYEPESPVEKIRRHRECWDLIPWLANETIAPRDYARIEPHLSVCHECQQELDAQQRMRAAMRVEDALVLAPQAGLQKLMQRIDSPDEEPTPASAPAATPRTRARPGWLAVAAAVQTIAIAALLAVQWRSVDERLTASRFETLTDESTMTTGGPVVRIVFERDISLNEVNALLRSVEGQIVAGPSEAGVYTLALGGAHADAAAFGAALERLRADARVLFAESAVARSAP